MAAFRSIIGWGMRVPDLLMLRENCATAERNIVTVVSERSGMVRACLR